MAPELDSLVAAARAYAAQTCLDGSVAAAQLQSLLLERSASTVSNAIKATRDVEYVRAVLTAARPGLTTTAPSAQHASHLAALRLAAYKTSLALLGVQAATAQNGTSQGGGSLSASAAVFAQVVLTERQAGELVSLLDTELGANTGAADLLEIAEAAMDAFESDAPLGFAALELLPKALALLQAAGGEVDVPNAAGKGTAACQATDVCQGIIRRVCQHAWPLCCIARVLASLRAFPLTQDNLKEAVQKAVQRAKLADAQDLPAVVHQLLMLSTRGCRELILTEIMRLFELKEVAVADSANQRRELLEVQGSVLLHIDMAVKHDAELGQAWLRRLRGEAPPHLSSFSLAVSFMLAGTQRFEQPFIDALKAVVLGAYKDAAALSACPWLPHPSSRVAAASGAGQVAALREALLQCARNTGHGQGGIVQPMVALAVGLIEAGTGSGFGANKTSNAAAAAAAAVTALGASAESAADSPQSGGTDDATEVSDMGASSSTPAQHAASLGTRLLLELFEAGRDFRKDIICLCQSRLIGAKEEVAAPYVRLLALLMRRNQATIGDHVAELKLSFEHLAFLPPHAALALLLAVWPMCRSRRDVQDYVVVLLRKAMFSRDLHARLLAARGFLHTITQELQSSSGGEGPGFDASEPGPSQVSMSQLSSLTGAGGDGATLLHEAMSFLRRCLTQQPEVQRVVYEGLPALLAADPSVQDSVVEPLLPHFLQFYESTDQIHPVLKLEACARLQGECVRLVEPLPHLLAAVRRLLLAVGISEGTEGGSTAGGRDDSSATAVLRSHFAKLRERLVDSTVEDFSLDATAEFGMSTPNGQLGQAQAGLLLGCMEVAMEDLVEELTAGPRAAAGAEGAEVEELGDALMKLYKEHARLTDLAMDGTKGSKGRKGEGLTQALGGVGRGSGAAQQAPVVPVDKRVPVLSLGCLAKLLDAVSDDGFKLPQSEGGGGCPTQESATKLCRDEGFVTFVLTAALRQLQACEASEVTAAIATGTAGSEAHAASVRRLFGVPDWLQLARPLFRAVQTVMLSHCKGRAERGTGVAGGKKEKDPTGPMTQAAGRALHQLLLLASAGGLPAVAAVMGLLPTPTAGAAAEADLPSAEGLTAAQRSVAAALPLFHELLSATLKPSCAKELESLCDGLALVVGMVPPAFADVVAGWAVEGLESLRDVKLPAAGKALLQLALKGKAAAAAAPSPAGGAALGGGGGRVIGGVVDPTTTSGACNEDGDDLALLLAVAKDVKGMLNADEEMDEGERFVALTARTYQGMLGVAGSHLDSVLSSLDWVLTKVRGLGAAARDASQGGADRQRLEATRQAWERAALMRLRRAAEVLGVLADARLIGAPCEHLVKSLTRLYKILVAAAKAQLPQKGGAGYAGGREGSGSGVSGAFSDLVSWVNRDCTPLVYIFLQDAHQTEGEGMKGGGEREAQQEEEQAVDEKAVRKRARAEAVAASKIKRESKQVPNLIFQIEEFERHLIRLSKAGKENLMITARRATNRDFKMKLKSGPGQGAGARAGKRQRHQQEQEEQQQEATEEEQAEEGNNEAATMETEGPMEEEYADEEQYEEQYDGGDGEGDEEA